MSSLSVNRSIFNNDMNFTCQMLKNTASKMPSTEKAIHNDIIEKPFIIYNIYVMTYVRS